MHKFRTGTPAERLTRVVRLLAVILLAAPALWAQRNELALQVGGTLTQRRTFGVPPVLEGLLPPGALIEDRGAAGGIVYRIRFASFGPAALMAEVPIFAAQARNQLVPVFADTSALVGFLTPGVALRLVPDARVSPYVFFGGGYARVVELQLTSSTPLRGGYVNEGTWAINYGGGADLRLLSFLSLRGELRNFYTGVPDATVAPILVPILSETRQRNTLVITAGVAFRF
jgi:hypothetical protein